MDQGVVRAAKPVLVAPTRTRSPVVLDPSQRQALDVAAAAQATLVVGAAGTGKTLVGLEIVLAAINAGLAPEHILVLAATRRAAAQLRDRLSIQAGRTLGAPMVRTAASAAFAVLRERAAAMQLPPPTLISGPEQDLILADVLAGHVAGEGVQVALPADLAPAALGLRGFRQELRDLLMRAAERGIDPVALAGLGRTWDRPEWVLGAQLYQEYLDVESLAGTTVDRGARYDPAIVVDEAADALATWDDSLAAKPQWSLVVVDDYQEATVAAARLLRVLHDDGARLVLLADPDSSVQTFRGATPALVGRATAPARADGVDAVGAFEADRVVLGTAWRQTADLRAVTARVCEHIGAVAGARHRAARAPAVPDPPGADRLQVPNASPEAGVARPPGAGCPEPGPGVGRPGPGAGSGPASGPGPSVRVAVLAGAAQEAAFIARELRAAHLAGTPWSDMAVICRTGARLAALRRGLITASVPVSVLGSDVPLRDEPAVNPLLAALRVACGADLDPLTAASLMTSPIGGQDVVALRRLRRALRAEELAGGGGRASDELLIEVLGDPDRCTTLPPTVRRGAAAVATALQAGRQAAAAPGANAQTVLWAMWDSTGLAGRWRAEAVEGGVSGARADRDLDAVLSMFRAAETFVERMPGSPPEAFAQYLESQDLPADSLAATASGSAAVSALTPAGAAGREWDVVVVAGVQDGVWPDLRLRDSLLGSQTLVEVYSGRSDDAHGVGPEARRAVLADELRSFAVATSRARRSLLVTAVEDTDDSPSVLLDLVDPPGRDREGAVAGAAQGDAAQGDAGQGGAEPPTRPVLTVGAPLDMRGLVATARSILVSELAQHATVAHTPSVQARQAAELLAALAHIGIREAMPHTWYGVAPTSTDAPLRGADAVVPVSPSRVESVDTCALRWVLESGGGTAPDAVAQSLGTLIHSIAQDKPTGTRTELLAELDRRWPELHLVPGWPQVQLRRRAEAMIDRLAAYFADRTPLLVEADFSLRVGRALLSGVVDRIEDAGAGNVRVVDIKTGRTAVSVADARENPQLGAYQLAVADGAINGLPPESHSVQAQLVYVGIGASATLRSQPALDVGQDGKSWAHHMVADAADTMAGSTFAAKSNKFCPMCPVRRSCPLSAEGRQVVE